MKKVFLIIGLFLLLILVWVGGGYLWQKTRQEDILPPKEEMIEEERIIGGDKDEHDCLVAAGYSWCGEKQKCLRVWEEGCDGATTFLTEIAKATKIEFTMFDQEVIFNWRLGEKKEVEAEGAGFSAFEISDEEVRRIETYLKDQGFEVSVENVSAGTISGSTGYLRDNFACLFVFGVSGYKEAEGQWLPPEPEKKDVEIKCGFFNE